MAFNGNGVFLRLFRWATDAANNVDPNAGRFDQEDDNFATGLSNCLTKDGQTQPTANIPMNGKKIVNLGTATASTDALSLGTADAKYVPLTQKDVAGGYPSLSLSSTQIAAAQVPALDASKITTGTLAAARLPTLAFSSLSGTIANAQVPQSAVTQFQGVLALSGSQIVSGSVPNATTAGRATFADRVNDLGGVFNWAAGFLEMPPNSSVNANYVFALSDSGKMLNHTSTSPHQFTVPNNATIAFNVGTVVTIVTSNTGGVITIVGAAGVTLLMAGTTNTGTRTLTPFGMASVVKIASDTWMISGVGLT